MPGMHGTYTAITAMQKADLLIAVGARFDDRVTGKISTFAPRAKIIHVDVDPSVIGQNVRTHLPIVGDLRQVLRVLNQLVEPTTHTEWLDEIEQLRREHPSLRIPQSDKLLQQYVIRQLSEETKGQLVRLRDA